MLYARKAMLLLAVALNISSLRAGQSEVIPT